MSVLKVKDQNDNWVRTPVGGVGVPSGGNSGDVLVKSSAVDYATGWQSVKSILPSPVELLPKTDCGLSSSGSISDRATLVLSESISNYRFVQIIMYSTLEGHEREAATIVAVPLYDGGNITFGCFADSSVGYYCTTMVRLDGTNLILRRVYYNNYSRPSYRIIGIP